MTEKMFITLLVICISTITGLIGVLWTWFRRSVNKEIRDHKANINENLLKKAEEEEVKRIKAKIEDYVKSENTRHMASQKILKDYVKDTKNFVVETMNKQGSLIEKVSNNLDTLRRDQMEFQKELAKSQLQTESRLSRLEEKSIMKRL
jgi:hypothetical protein